MRDDGVYHEDRETNLYDYMTEKGFNFLDLSVVEQLSYSSNFLTISDGKIMCVNSYKVYERLLKNNIISREISERGKFKMPSKGDPMFPVKEKMNDYGIDFITVDLEELTGGYGGAHCMTMALERN